MPKPIGPTFADELKDANVFGLPFAWGDDGTFTFGENMAKEDIEKVKRVYEAHDPTIAK